MENILPTLDMAVLQEKANEYAMKGALKSIEEYYTGYNSPFRKKIDEELQKKVIGSGLQLPDIIGILNDSMAKEIDIIANSAMSQTYLPMVKRFLTREEKEMNFSEILKNIIEGEYIEDRENCYVNIEEDEKFGWLRIKIQIEKKEYDFTLHVKHDTEKDKVKKYHLLSLPYNLEKAYGYNKQVIKVKQDDVTLELPFLPNILNDRVIAFMARLIIAQTIITMDCDNFSDDMFPERCHCD